MSSHKGDRTNGAPGLEIYFFRVRLIQKNADPALVYEGTGKAFQEADGRWGVEVIHEDETAHQEEEPAPAAGVPEAQGADGVISAFAMEAVDLSGNPWEAETVRLGGPVPTQPARGQVVRGAMDGFICRNCPAGPLEDEIWIMGEDDFEP